MITQKKHTVSYRADYLFNLTDVVTPATNILAIFLLSGRTEINGQGFSQRHPSNWVDAEEDDNDEDGNDHELCVQSTPPYYEEQ